MKGGSLRLALILSAQPFLVTLTAQDTKPSNADWKWLGENFDQAIDRTMPLQKDIHVVVSYRMHETLQVGEPEYSFVIVQGTTPASLSVHVRTPYADPIGKQLLLLHRRFPHASIAALGKKLKFVDLDLTEQQCPRLKEAVQRLNAIPLSIQLDSTMIIMDPTVHELFIRSNQESVHLSIVDPESPPVRWARETRNVIQACDHSVQ